MTTSMVETMICRNPDCPHQGKSLPLTEFNEGRRTCKDCDRKRAREHARKRREKLWAERKPIIDKWLGTKCVVCHETKEKLLRCHEIYGNPHPPLLPTPIDEVARNCKSERFVRVCAKCHGKAHSLMDKDTTGWAQICSIIKDFLATNPPMSPEKHTCVWRSWLKKRLKQARLVVRSS